MLRSSAAPEGDRQHLGDGAAVVEGEVAILGRPGGQPPVRPGSGVGRLRAVAILGRPRGRPPGWASATVAYPVRRLRSSVAPESDCQGRLHGFGEDVQEVAILGRPGGQPPAEIRARLPLKLDVAILGRPRGRPPHPRRPSSRRHLVRCDPRSPRRATATLPGRGQGTLHLAVANLGRPGGRPPPRTRAARWATDRELRSSVASKGDRHHGYVAGLVLRRSVAVLGRPGGRPPGHPTVRGLCALVGAIRGCPEGRPPLRPGTLY